MGTESFFSNAAANYVGGLGAVITIAVLSFVNALLKSKGMSWARLALDTLVGWVCLCILIYGLPTGAVTSVAWWWVYVLGVVSFVFFVVMDWMRRKPSDSPVSAAVPAAVEQQPTTKFIEFYDSRTEKNSLSGDLAKELAQSSQVWFAAIGGSQVTDIPELTFQKLHRVLLVNPNSECMKMLIALQPDRGKLFPGLVEEAVAKCQKKGKEVKLSDEFVLNVIIGDLEKPTAWARVQSFIPYYLGQDSPSYVVRELERPELFKRIKDSFDQMWKNATKPEERDYSHPVK